MGDFQSTMNHNWSIYFLTHTEWVKKVRVNFFLVVYFLRAKYHMTPMKEIQISLVATLYHISLQTPGCLLDKQSLNYQDSPPPFLLLPLLHPPPSSFSSSVLLVVYSFIAIGIILTLVEEIHINL